MANIDFDPEGVDPGPAHRHAGWRGVSWCVVALCCAGMLSACGGGSGGVAQSGSTTTEGALITPIVTSASTPSLAMAADAASKASLGVVSASSSVLTPEGFASTDTQANPDAGTTADVGIAAVPVPDPGVLMLLLPDTQNQLDPAVLSWIDAASEVGVRVTPITDSQFLQLGTAAAGFAGLILPDGLHTQATDALITAIGNYTRNGGRTMLVFDFGALTLSNGVPVYPIPKSRLSDLAGVDYVLYDALREKTTGLGPVTAPRSVLRSLWVPPGKSMPYAGTVTATSSGVSSSSLATTTTAMTASGLMGSAGISSETALYLPVSPQDPGGARGFDPQQYSEMRYYSSAKTMAGPATPRSVTVDLGRAIKSTPLGTTAQVSSSTLSVTAAADPVEAYSGYLLGHLLYPSYVTQGSFGGLPGQQVLATSPQFGLVSGVNPYGSGQVLFVNLPLTYLKGRTDALMMHGYLRYFSHRMINMAHLSPMPNGVAGMTFDWHLDSMAAQAPTQSLMKLNVFNDPKALFSIEMTAGPDAIIKGDNLGWNLSNNAVAQKILKTFKAAGHAVGAHGGWIHDFYGLNASETNELLTTNGACLKKGTKTDNYKQCLVLNRQAVDGVIATSSRSYSAPEGNNPLWAMRWLENQGVVSAYFGGHTGLGATRQYRNGSLLNPRIWVFPVTPQGLYATFEEFQYYNVPQSEVTAWYRDLVDFCIAQNTSRMVYAHPPGADQWSTVLLDFMNYAKSQGVQFNWYTSTRLSDFLTTRLKVSWSQTLDPVSGLTQFSVSHPSSLNEMAWRLPKSKYAQMPVIVSGVGSVSSQDSNYWLVKAGVGTTLVFKA